MIDELLGFSNALTMWYKLFVNFSILSPSSALRITINTGPQAFYGEKYKIDKVSSALTSSYGLFSNKQVFEDDGTLVSGATSAAYDSERHRLFLHGNSRA